MTMTSQTPILRGTTAEQKHMIVGAVLNSIGPLGVWSMPLILAVFARHMELDNTAAGMLASAALTGACVVALAQALLFRILPQRAMALCCIAALLLAYLGLLIEISFVAALALMFFLGVGMGGLLVTSLVAAKASGQISRISATGLIGQAGISAAIAWVASQYHGVEADRVLVGLLVTVTACGMLLLPWVSSKPVAGEREAEQQHHSSGLLIAALLAWGLANFASGGFWPLTERIGAANGLTHPEIGQAIAYSSLAGIAGALAAMVLGRSLALFVAILFIGIGTVLVTLGIVNATAALGFALAMTGFGFLWNFAPPYQLPIIAAADRAGNGMAWTILSLKVFMAVGPIAYGAIADRMGFKGAAVLAIAASLASTCLFCALLFLERRAKPVAGGAA